MLVVIIDAVLVTSESFRLHIILMRQVDQLALEVVVAAALQTSGGFFLSLLRSESIRNDLGEVVLSLLSGQLRDLRTALPFSVFESLFGDIVAGDEIRFFVTYGLTVQISVDDLGCFLSIGDRLDRDADLVITAVTTGEDAFHRRHESFLIVRDRALAGLVAFEDGRVDGLSDGQDHVVQSDGLGLALDRYRTATSGLIRLTQFHALQHDLLDVAVLILDDLQRVGQVLEDNAFFLGFFDLDHIRRHLVLSTTVNVVDFLGSQTDGCSAGVHRGVAAADDRDLVAQLDRLVADYVAQEIDTADDALSILARASDAGGDPCSDSQQYGVKVVAYALERDVYADLGIGDDVNAHLFNGVDLIVQFSLWKTILRNAVAQHAASLWHGLEDRDIVTHLAQEVSCGKSQRAAADDGYCLAGVRITFRDELGAGAVHVRNKTLQGLDCDRLVDQASAAVILARMRADTAQGCRKRDLVFDQLVGLVVFAVGDQADVALAVGACRACQYARRSAVTGVVGKQQLQVGFS